MTTPLRTPGRARSLRRRLAYVLLLGAALVVALLVSTRDPASVLPGLIPRDEPAFEREVGLDERDVIPRALPSIVAAELLPLASREIVSPSEAHLLSWLVGPQDPVEADQPIAKLSAPGQAELLAQAEARLGVARHLVRTIGHLVAEGYEPQANLDRAQERLDAALAQLEAAQEASAAAQIVSPVSGVLVELLKREGDAVVTGEEVARVRAIEDRLVVVSLPAERARELGVGKSIKVNLAGRSFYGVLRRIGSTQGQPTVRVEVVLPYDSSIPLDAAPAEIVMPLNKGR